MIQRGNTFACSYANVLSINPLPQIPGDVLVAVHWTLSEGGFPIHFHCHLARSVLKINQLTVPFSHNDVVSSGVSASQGCPFFGPHDHSVFFTSVLQVILSLDLDPAQVQFHLNEIGSIVNPVPKPCVQRVSQIVSISWSLFVNAGLQIHFSIILLALHVSLRLGIEPAQVHVQPYEASILLSIN